MIIKVERGKNSGVRFVRVNVNGTRIYSLWNASRRITGAASLDSDGIFSESGDRFQYGDEVKRFRFSTLNLHTEPLEEVVRKITERAEAVRAWVSGIDVEESATIEIPERK